MDFPAEISVDNHTFYSENDEDKTLIMVMGPEGSNKGLFTAELAKAFDFGLLSMGELISEASMEPTNPYFLLVFALHENDECVPAEILCGLLLHAMRSRPLSRFIIDDFPENVTHMFALNDFVLPHIKSDLLVYLHCPKDHSLHCCLGDHEQISKDFRTMFVKKLNAAKHDMEPIVEFYRERQLLVEVDATRDFDIVLEEVATGVVNILEPVDHAETISLLSSDTN